MTRIFFALSFWAISLVAFSQGLSKDTIHWIDHRKLTWDDFKGEPIDVQSMSGQTLMVLLANFQKSSLFLPTRASVANVFDRRNSWINSNAKNDDALKYYQVMFDLYEVYARRLKKDFRNTKFGLNPNKVFQEKYDATLTALSDRNKEYLKETKVGTDAAAVEKWNHIIKAELKELEAYK